MKSFISETGAYVFGFIVFVVLLAMAFQISREEKRQVAGFGEESAEYKSRTFRFIPIRKG